MSNTQYKYYAALQSAKRLQSDRMALRARCLHKDALRVSHAARRAMQRADELLAELQSEQLAA